MAAEKPEVTSTSESSTAEKEPSTSVGDADAEQTTTSMQDEQPVETDVDVLAKATDLLSQGKRHMVCNDIPAAVNSFQEASEILSKKYGESADECGDAYFQYGRALLELARVENGVLGNALDGVPEEDSGDEEPQDDSKVEDPEKVPAEEKDKIVEEVGKAIEENTKTLESKKEDTEKQSDTADVNEAENTAVEDKTEEAEDNVEPTNSDDNDATSVEVEAEDNIKEAKDNTDAADDAQVATGSEDDKKDEAEDVDNLQLAWEMLELAKVIFSRKEDNDSKLKVADIHLKLGEISMESDNNEQCVDDFLECLKIREQLLDGDDRSIAETHYQLGLAYGLTKDFSAAVISFKSAVGSIEGRIKHLQAVVDSSGDKGKSPASSDDPITKAQKEIAELQALLPEISAKIEDSEDSQKQVDDLRKSAVEAVAAEFGMGDASGGISNDKPAQDISSMVRRKRKPEDDILEDAKKTKVVNGSGDAPATNGHSNGVNGDSSVTEELKTKTVEDVKNAEAQSSVTA